MAQAEQNVLERFRRRIFTFSFFYTLAAMLLIALVSIYPFYTHLKKSEKETLLSATRDKALAVGEYLSRLSEIGLQFTSRTVIRQKLQEYLRGKISQEQVVAFTSPKLADALRQSKEALGVLRLGPGGETVGQSGLTLPKSFRRPPGPQGTKTVISDPFFRDRALYLVVEAPIIGPGGERLGTDMVLFSAAELRRLVLDSTGLGKRAQCWLGRMSKTRLTIFLPGAEGSLKTALPGKEISTLFMTRERTGLIEYGRQKGRPAGILAFASVPSTGWMLFAAVPQGEVLSRVYHQLFSLAGVIFLVALLGACGLFFLLRPLTNRMLDYSAQLKRLNTDLQKEVDRREEVEKSLRRGQQEWTQTFDSITDAVAIIDLDGQVIKMNRAAAAFRKKLAAHTTGTPTCRVFSGLARHEGSCPFDNLLKTRQPEQCELHEPVTSQEFLVSVFPLLDEEGEVRGAVHIAHDVTEQKKMERLKDEMISSVSHEMRTPLTAMLGFVEFLLGNEVSPEQQRDFLQIVHRETQRLNELISNFLDLQRLQADLETYQMEPLAVETLLQEAAQLFAVASSRHTIVVECPPGLPPVRGDLRRLGQVLKNLISNAIRYSPEGGKVTLGATGGRQEVTVWVKDEGVGIPPESLKRIFSRFYRVEKGARRIPGGIGLGLALVQEMVRAHGGRVWAKSTVGQGSTFYFTVPVARSSER